MTTNPTYRQRRQAHYRSKEHRAYMRGFCVGFLVALTIIAALLTPALASAQTRPAPALRADAWPPAGVPPHYRTWLRIGMCEQPKRGISWLDVRTDRQRWRSIAWRQEYNWSFLGGLGLTRLNWETFRPRSARHIPLMSRATPVQQLWAAERLWRWAERTYPGAGFTAWECSRIIGWTTSDPDDALR